MHRSKELQGASVSAGSVEEDVNRVLTAIAERFNIHIRKLGRTLTPSTSLRDRDQHGHIHEAVKYLYFQDKQRLVQLHSEIEQWISRSDQPTLPTRPGDRLAAVASAVRSIRQESLDAKKRAGKLASRSFSAILPSVKRSTTIPDPAAQSFTEGVTLPPRHHDEQRPLSQPDFTKSSEPASRSPENVHDCDLSSTEEESDAFDTAPASPSLPPSRLRGSVASRKRLSDPHDRVISAAKYARTLPIKLAASTSSRNSSFDSLARPSGQTSFDAKSTAKTSFNDPDPGAVEYPSLDGPPAAKQEQFSDEDSTFLEHFQVRDLPNAGMFGVRLPDDRLTLPFPIIYDLTRLSQHSLTDQERRRLYSSGFVDYGMFWSYACATIPKSKLITMGRPSQAVIDAAKSDSPNVIASGTLTFNTRNKDSIFNLQLNPLQLDKSCRFQRAFGADRFLYLDVPALNRDLPEHLRDQAQHIEKRWIQWLMTEKTFLGRKWRVVMTEQKKNKVKGGVPDHRLALFALEGRGLMTMRIEDLIEWHLPVLGNSQQPACKAFSRLELGFSRTTPTLVFRPSQISIVPCKLAEDVPDDMTFNDAELRWDSTYCKGTEMDDGCCVISLGAARKVWQMLGKQGPIPSAFQARIGGAKGVWTRSAPPENTDSFHNDIWININPTQRKVIAAEEDLHESTFNSLRTTFEVVKYSTPASSSYLHIAFFPILKDRGVTDDVLHQVAKDHISYEARQILAVVRDPVKLRHWASRESRPIPSSHGGERDNMNGMPSNLSETIVTLLEAGFSPKEFRFLADQVQRLVSQYLIELRGTLRIPMKRSTSVFGIADPTDTLMPGEIHMAFSDLFRDDENELGYSSLDGREVLVARHPALRSSDVQKVRAVFKKELESIRDVVVFPSTGPCPLASKLQGGDYDGDTFWLCWEPWLTQPFKNAPAPTSKTMPTPQSYGIRIRDQALGHFSTDQLLRTNFELRCRQSYLGIVTNMYESVTYWQNSISTEAAESLAGLHDYLVDSYKRGYSLSGRALTSYEGTLGLKLHQKKDPARYKTAMKADLQTKKRFGRPIGSGAGKPLKVQYNKAHVNDVLYFEIFVPETDKIIKEVEDIYTGSVNEDMDLNGPCTYEWSHADDAIRKELKSLESRLEGVRDKWRQLMNTTIPMTKHCSRGMDSYFRCVQQCADLYHAIQPLNETNHPIITRWNHATALPGLFTHWHLLKASALYTLASNFNNVRLPFSMAFRELAFLKVCRSSGVHTRFLTPLMRDTLRPRREHALAESVPVGTTVTPTVAAVPKARYAATDIFSGAASSIGFDEDELDEEAFVDPSQFYDVPDM